MDACGCTQSTSYAVRLRGLCSVNKTCGYYLRKKAYLQIIWMEIGTRPHFTNETASNIQTTINLRLIDSKSCPNHATNHPSALYIRSKIAYRTPPAPSQGQSGTRLVRKRATTQRNIASAHRSSIGSVNCQSVSFLFLVKMAVFRVSAGCVWLRSNFRKKKKERVDRILDPASKQ